MKYIIIDGYLNGTGIRDKYNGGYVQPESLNLSQTLVTKLKSWLLKYESEFLNNYSDLDSVISLDEEGKQIATLIKRECVDIKIEYYSDANMLTFDVE